ncbi:type I polyketide synthase [Amycolatopsis japonica]
MNSYYSDRASTSGADRPIAIVGLACRFPGARNTDELWDLLCDGVDATRAVPRSRFDIDEFYSQVPATQGKVASRRCGLVADADKFDAEFFGIGSYEARLLDPQQRLLMMAAWEAFEDAGQPPEQYRGSRTGVFIGQMNSDYWDLQSRRDPADLTLYSFTGSHQRSMAAGRLSFTFDLRGPSVVVDTACSSSLLAVHQACQSVRSGESAMAVAGGVNLVLTPNANIMYSQARMLAPDGQCKFADARADGLVRSDGVAVVILKTLEQALHDGDRIRAIIRGGAAGNDGGDRPHITAPSLNGHRQTLESAYQAAGVRPADVDYLEAHGTGTRIDLVELTAFAEVLGKDRPADRPLLVGSVKTNIGHAEAAAGMAGLIKTVLCLEHGQVPPNLHYETPHPKFDWENAPLIVPTRMYELPSQDRPWIAGVNSQGISSTNVHLVLAQARRDKPRDPAVGRPHLLALSARTEDALNDLVSSYLAYLASGGPGRAHSLRDICFTAGPRRAHHEIRLAVVGATHDEILAALHSRRDPLPPRVLDDDRRLLEQAAQEYAATGSAAWEQLCEPFASCVPVPGYPWQLARFWLGDEPEAEDG